MPHVVSRRVPLVALALTAAACADPSAPATPGADAPAPLARVAGPVDQATQPIPDQYIVVFRDDVADAPGLARRLAGSGLRYTYQHAVKGFSAHMNAQAAAALARNPNVAYVEQDQVVTISQTTSVTWGLDRIDQRPVTLDGKYVPPNDGSGVTAYIIDTGIDAGHSEFTGRISSAYFDAFADGQNGNDCNGHGTHVAGTVGGTTYGVAKGVTLVAVRVLDCGGSGSWSGVVAGVDWVVSHHVSGPAVSNMSLGGGASSTVDAAVDRMIDDGVASAVAAGNGNMAGIAQDACNYSPARVPRAMTIGATTKSDAKTSWSNYGACVDWFAPGASITSAWIGDGNNDVNTISGTSMATPHVAGVAALYLKTNPTKTPAEVSSALHSFTTKGIVTSSKTANNHLLFSGMTVDGGTESPPDDGGSGCTRPNGRPCK